MVWILVFVLSSDPVTSPVSYHEECFGEDAVGKLLKQKGISQGFCFSVSRIGAKPEH